MLAFMAYVVLIAALLGIAARVCERWIRELGFASRGIWFGALLVSVALPLTAVIVSPDSSDSSVAAVAAAPGAAGSYRIDFQQNMSADRRLLAANTERMPGSGSSNPLSRVLLKPVK